MNLSPHSILLIGYLATLILFVLGSMKKLRNDNIIKVTIAGSLIFAFVGYAIRNDNMKMAVGNAADSFFGPFIYIITYAAFRYFYKKKFVLNQLIIVQHGMITMKEGGKTGWMLSFIYFLSF